MSTHTSRSRSDDTSAGKWVLLFSHPADFTPVCTTEFMAYARLNEEFEKRNVQLIGLSVDSVNAHLAWTHDIEEHLGVRIPLSIIADLDMKVATTYGMIHPGASATSTVHAVFIIDPKGILRAMVYDPLTTGRNMDEFIRVIDALQITDTYGVSTPANWRPGDEVIVPAPTTVQQLKEEETKKAEYDYKRWYLRLRHV